jgi:exonuclease VII large subunit
MSSTAADMQVDTPTGAAASSAAGSSTAAASSSPATAASSSAVDTLLLRETRFFHQSPRIFVDDLLNAAGDYIGFACDELEKAAGTQVIKNASKTAKLAEAVDKMYQEIDARLRRETGRFEEEVYGANGVLRIAPNIITSGEMKNHTSGGSSLGLGEHDGVAEAAADAHLSSTLLALQARVARSAALNRALREQLARHKADEEAYAENEDEFSTSKKVQQQEAAILAQAEAIRASLHDLRTVHDAVSTQFTSTFGAEEAEGLKAGNTGSVRQQAEGGGEVTRQINLAAQMGDVTQMIGTTAAAAPGATTAAAATSMNIDEDQASML